MELRIKITKKNKEKIFALITSYLEDENIELETAISTPQIQVKGDYLSIPTNFGNLESGNILRYGTQEDIKLNLVGTWGQFNSFFPIKAALRILANTMIEKEAPSINFNEFVYNCTNIFSKKRIRNKRLGKFRGFPRRKKDTAIGRFVWHFLTPAHEMGLIKIISTNYDHKGIPYSPNDWSKINVAITKEGLDFAILDNFLFDNSSLEQVLSEDERIWIINYLKKIDKKGFGEYSLLRDVYNYIKQGHNGKDDLWSWFENDKRFIEYILSWSRKSDNPDELRKQITNLAKTFSTSKIALLRELGVLRNKRGDYGVIGEL